MSKNYNIDLRYKVFMNLVTWCGLRTGEVLGLTWDDVNFSTRTLYINKSEVKSVGKGRVKKAQKAKKANAKFRLMTGW